MMVQVVEVCPVLRVEWLPPNPLLLGGPEEEVSYVISYAPPGGIPVSETFLYTSSVTVRRITPRPYTVLGRTFSMLAEFNSKI